MAAMLVAARFAADNSTFSSQRITTSRLQTGETPGSRQAADQGVDKGGDRLVELKYPY